MTDRLTLHLVESKEFPYAGGTKKGFSFKTQDGTEYVAFDPELWAAYQKVDVAPRDYIVKPGENGKSPMIVAIPGIYEKQQRGGGGGRPQGKSPEERASIEKQVALKAAVELFGGAPVSAPHVLSIATDFYAWLQDKPSGTAQSEGGAVSSGQRETPSPPVPEGQTSEVAELRDGEARSKAASDTTSDGGRSDSGGQAPPSEYNEDAPANPEQIENIKGIYGGVRSATKTAVDRYKIGGLNDLTQGQAAEMISEKFKG